MPFTTEQLSYAGKIALDYNQKNKPIDQVNQVRPLLAKLMAGKKDWTGGLQYITAQLRYQNDSNFMSYFGDQQVGYNRKRTITQAKFAYGSFHDGFGLDEDELTQNGITMTDDKGGKPEANELVQLTNLLEENMISLNEGFQEKFDLMLHRDGSASVTDIPGLDALIALDPTATATVGTLAQNTYTWWRNYANITITAAQVVDKMEIAWRACTQYGGNVPDLILCGSEFLDNYRTYAGTTVNRQLNAPAKGGVSLDPSVEGVYFHGIPVVWDPTFDALQAADAPATSWKKRCYFINTKFLQLRPIKGHWMVSRRPPRAFDRYVHYWALTSKAALTTGKRNAHAVLAIS